MPTREFHELQPNLARRLPFLPFLPPSESMKPNKTSVALAALLTAGIACAQAPAGDANRGRERVQMCQGCHGIDGWRTAFPEVYHVPKLSGQHAQYLAVALQAYRSGARSHPSMKAIAASLSDQDIADLAAYYAQPANAAPGKK